MEEGHRLPQSVWVPVVVHALRRTPLSWFIPRGWDASGGFPRGIPAGARSGAGGTTGGNGAAEIGPDHSTWPGNTWPAAAIRIERCEYSDSSVPHLSQPADHLVATQDGTIGRPGRAEKGSAGHRERFHGRSETISCTGCRPALHRLRWAAGAIVSRAVCGWWRGHASELPLLSRQLLTCVC